MPSHQGVLAAIAEYEQLGRARFLSRYGYGPSSKYFLRHNGRIYDSKAIFGVATGHDRERGRPLRSDGVRRRCRNCCPTSARPWLEIVEDATSRLRRGQTYSWAEVASEFWISGRLPEPSGRNAFGPREDELVFTGKGQSGNQQPKARTIGFSRQPSNDLRVRACWVGRAMWRSRELLQLR